MTTVAATATAAPPAIPNAQASTVNGLAGTKQDSPPPAVPPRPPATPAAIAPDQAGISGLVPAPNDDIGVGQLRPATAQPSAPGSPEEQSGASWLRGVVLPIYPSPESDHWGWLINGWLIPNDAEPLAIGRDAAFSMVQTEPGIYTFPVLEIRPDGWFSFQYTSAGVAWAHTAHLDLGTTPLTLETWEVSIKDSVQLQFRRPGLSQPMRLAPSGSAPLQALVGPNSIMKPLELEGDWLRVRVTQPAQGCTPLPGASTAEGWVRWRNEADMPLVWFSPSGCQ
ncbi:MAG: hypothetical protein EA368_13965 [Leptolyngbya sp. DLM2.Bin27]|nr:MAG: hypothetical protein EA368_13965 [Leptolyngbya sp. DLM2.Bin27]